MADGEAMNLHLTQISRNVATDSHAVVLLDGAGWHQTGGKLKIPDSCDLPRVAPEGLIADGREREHHLTMRFRTTVLLTIRRLILTFQAICASERFLFRMATGRFVMVAVDENERLDPVK
jgi:hypothetical protein